MDFETKDFIENNIDKDQFVDLIEKTATVAWDEKVKRRKIEEWIGNFTGECLGDKEIEQKIAAWLLLNFTFYTIKDVKKLCQDIFQQFLREELNSNTFEDGLTRDQKINRILEECCFVPLGNPSESGAKVLYDFRTVNNLGKDLFDAEKKKCRCLVLIDDVSISGTQAIEYLPKCSIEAEKVYFLTFMATPAAIKNIEDEKKIKLIYSIYLDSRTKCFSSDSFVFRGEKEEKIKMIAMEMCQYYGNKIMSIFSDPNMQGYPLGFNNDQQMLGFYYNTPDNTLPIFWCDENWKGIFIRYNKIYGKGRLSIDDEQFI